MPEAGPGTVRRFRRAGALLACLLVAAPAFAILNGLPADGEPAIAGSTVAIVIEDRSRAGPDGRPGYYPSTGIVVAPGWILTVKHAFAEFNRPQHVWQVHLMPEIRGGGAESRVRTLDRASVILHPTLDLALIRLDQPMPFEYRPARLVTDGRRLAREPVFKGLLAGYGTSGAQSPQNRLRFVEAPISALSLVDSKRWPDLVEPALAAHHLELDQREGRGSCSGDSGGPVFARLAGGGLGVVGVIRGNASYDGAHPCLGFSYAVRVDRAIGWLAQVTGRIYDPASMQLVESVADIAAR